MKFIKPRLLGSVAIAFTFAVQGHVFAAGNRDDTHASNQQAASAEARRESDLLERYLLAQRERTPRVLDALVPRLEQSREPLAWVWAAGIVGGRMEWPGIPAVLKSEVNPSTTLAQASGDADEQTTRLKAQRDQLLLRALQAAPQNPAVLMSLYQECLFRPSAFCMANTDLVDRWHKSDPENGLALIELSRKKSVALQAELLTRALNAPKIVSYPEEIFRMTLQVDAELPAAEREELVTGLLSLGLVSAISIVRGPDVCGMVMRAAKGYRENGDIDPGPKVKAQCVELMRRVAREEHDPLWVQYAALALRSTLPAGSEVDQLNTLLSKIAEDVIVPLQVDVAVYEGRLPVSESYKLLRKYMVDAQGQGRGVAQRNYVASGRKLLEQANSEARKL